jgi:uncharacterized protein involved in exopolysaccharide biosynthesis
MAANEPDDQAVHLKDAVRGYFVPVLDTGAVEPVTFTELLKAIRVRWWWPLLGALLGLALAVTLAFLMQPVYHGKVVFLPAKEATSSSALGALAGNLGGLASLAGINLSGDSNEAENMAVLNSRGFTERFIVDHDLLHVLFAKRWDAERGQWKPHPWKRDPTLADAVRKFDRKIRSVTEERRSGVATLVIEWRDREEAARWANDLIAQANEELRNRAMAMSARNIEYLQREAADTDVVGIQQSVYRLIENELRRSMMASVHEEFAFRVLDPAVVPEEHEFVRPKRLLMSAAGLVLGFGFALMLAISAHLLRRNRPEQRAGATS